MVEVLTFPLRNDLPQYSFSVTLTGVIYNAQIVFNVRMNRWIMNLSDINQNPILVGIPVLIRRDLTGQYATLSIPEGLFLAVDNTGKDEQATQFSFGVDHSCYYLDPGVA